MPTLIARKRARSSIFSVDLLKRGNLPGLCFRPCGVFGGSCCYVQRWQLRCPRCLGRTPLALARRWRARPFDIWWSVLFRCELFIVSWIPSHSLGAHLNWGRSLWTYLVSRVMYGKIGYPHHLFFFCFCFLCTTQWLLLSQLFWVNYTHMAGFCISEASCNRSFEQHNKALCNGKEPAGHCWYYPCFLLSHEWVYYY